MNAMYEEVFGKFARFGDKYCPVMAMYNHVMLDNRKLFKIARIIYCDEYWTFHSRDLVSEFYKIIEIPIDTARLLYESYLEKTNGKLVIKEKLIDKCQDYLVDKVESDTMILLGKCRAYKGRFSKYPEYERALKLVTEDYNNMDFRLINMISRKDEFR
jgi:hypothetical protein